MKYIGSETAVEFSQSSTLKHDKYFIYKIWM
jgi:hypothetical protein